MSGFGFGKNSSFQQKRFAEGGAVKWTDEELRAFHRNIADHEMWRREEEASAQAAAQPLASPNPPKKAKDKGVSGHLQDAGLSLAKGVISVPEFVVGALDIPTLGYAGKAVEGLGIRFKDAKDMLSEYHTDKYKEQQQEFENADGTWEKAKYALKNPSLITNTTIESLPAMGGGAGIARLGLKGLSKAVAQNATARGAKKTAATRLGNRVARHHAIAAGAAGEGLVSGGLSAEGIRQQTDDGLLTGKQAALAAASGVGTAGFGYLGGRAAKRLGLVDFETATAGGVGQQAGKGFGRRVVGGAISEGILEELPQSLQEQAMQNIALGKPWSEGLEEAAVLGILSGGLMGGGMNLLPGSTPKNNMGGNQTTPGNPQTAPVTQNHQIPGIDALDSAPLPHEQMGINPAAGPLSDVAARAVDSSVSLWETMDRDERLKFARDAGLAEIAVEGFAENPKAWEQNALVQKHLKAGENANANNIGGQPSGAGNLAGAVLGNGTGTTGTSGTERGGDGTLADAAGLQAASALPALQSPPAAGDGRRVSSGLESSVGNPLQNRNRSTAASVVQMQSIANAPDYQRLSTSRDFANGAPVISGAQIPEAQLGRMDIAVGSDGRHIPVQYAVVEAGSVLASNNADGTPNANYRPDYPGAIAIAGNGRIAGLQQAYRQGTAGNYALELFNDAQMTGIDPAALAGMQNPVLVRVMNREDVTADIGDVSNTTSNLDLSPVERAKNDANRIELEALSFNENGSISPQTVRDFVVSMPQSEQGGLLDAKGQPTRQAYDRLNAAIFVKGYADGGLVELYAQAQDMEATNVLKAMAEAAPQMARLEGMGAFDIRQLITEAAGVVVTARRNGVRLEEAARQLDMSADPLTGDVVDFFARNIRSGKRIAEGLKRLATTAYNEATRPETDMFGATPDKMTRKQLVSSTLGENNGQQGTANLEQQSGAQPLQQDAGRGGTDGRGQGNRLTPEAGRTAPESGRQESRTPLELTRETEAEASEAARHREEADSGLTREQIDRERGAFSLSGQSQPKAQGVQQGLFTADGKASVASQAAEKTQSARRDRIPGMEPHDAARGETRAETSHAQTANDRDSAIHLTPEQAARKIAPVHLRERALSFLRKKFKKQDEVTAQNGDKIIISYKGLEHSLHGKPTPEKVVTALHIKELVASSELAHRESDKNGRSDPYAVSRYDTQVEIDRTAYDFLIFVRNHTDGNRYYDHAVIRERGKARQGHLAANQGDSPIQPSVFSGLSLTIEELDGLVNESSEDSASTSPRRDAGEQKPDTAREGTGHAQPLYAKVFTPSGWREMGSLAVGDVIYAANGEETTVEGIYPQGVRPVFIVNGQHGGGAHCTADHLWTVREEGTDEWKTIPTSVIMAGMKTGIRYELPEVSSSLQAKAATLAENKRDAAVCGGAGLENRYLSLSIAVGTNLMRRFISLARWFCSIQKRPRNWFMKFVTRLLFLPCFKASYKISYLCFKFTNAILKRDFFRLKRIDSRAQPLVFLSQTRVHLEHTRELIELLDELIDLLKDRLHEISPSYVVSKKDVAPKKVDRKFITDIMPAWECEVQCIKIAHPSHLYLTDNLIPTHNTWGDNPVFTEYRNDPEGAIARLLQEKAGEARAVVTREGLGEIDLVWGDEKSGLAHIAQKHPEILPRLAAILREGELRDIPGNRKRYLITDRATPEVAVIALDYNGEKKTWVVTAYEDVQGTVSGRAKSMNSGEVTSKEGDSLSSRKPDSSVAQTEAKASAPTGHAQPLHALVLTPSGYRKMGDLAVGDPVLAASGEETIVEGIYPQGIQPVFRVITDDGTATLATEDHLWTVREEGETEWKTVPTSVIIAGTQAGKRYELPEVGQLVLEKTS